MPTVETYSYDKDDGKVEAETVITVGDTEFVIVQDGRRNEHRVFQRERGAEQPFKQWAPEERPLSFPPEDDPFTDHEAHEPNSIGERILSVLEDDTVESMRNGNVASVYIDTRDPLPGESQQTSIDVLDISWKTTGSLSYAPGQSLAEMFPDVIDIEHAVPDESE